MAKAIIESNIEEQKETIFDVDTLIGGISAVGIFVFMALLYFGKI